MDFEAILSVTISDKQLQTVVKVDVKGDSKKIGSECDIRVPINCRIQYTDGKHDYLTAYPQVLFKVGDVVTITAQYTGYPTIQVFNGYVYNFVEGDEVVIRCTDYIYLLYQTTVNLSYASITIKDLVTTVLKGTGITLLLPTIELTLVNISFRLMSPGAILEWLKKELGINISLTGKTLYMNLASNTLSSVIFNTSRNVLKSDLQTPDAIFQTFKVKAWFIRENGTKDSLEVGDTNGQLHEVFFYKVPVDMALYNQLATEALNKVKQQKYGGMIETLLYPDCGLYWQANYTDVRYPDRSGSYTITEMNFEIGEKGFHRKIKMAYLSGLNTTG